MGLPGKDKIDLEFVMMVRSPCLTKKEGTEDGRETFGLPEGF